MEAVFAPEIEQVVAVDGLGWLVDHDHQEDVGHGRREEHVKEASARFPIDPLDRASGEVMTLEIHLRN